MGMRTRPPFCAISRLADQKAVIEDVVFGHRAALLQKYPGHLGRRQSRSRAKTLGEAGDHFRASTAS